MEVPALDHLSLTVTSITLEAEKIVSLKLVDALGKQLPKRTAGAHIELYLPGGLVRQYSLCNAAREEDIYEIAVLKEDAGRGGSIAMHALQIGQVVAASKPKNNFQLAGTEAVHHLLVGGGIGITPLLAMVDELQARSADFHLHFCAKGPSQAPFLDRVEALVKSGSATIHFDGGNIANGLDLEALLETPIPAQHVYVCGPPGMLDAARNFVGAWAPHTVHFERFAGGPVSMEEDEWEDVPFDVVANRSGLTIPVPAGCSIVSALRSAGISVPVLCEAGFCGACLTRYIEGKPVHRDTVLSRSERRTHTLICRARSQTKTLTLDL